MSNYNSDCANFLVDTGTMENTSTTGDFLTNDYPFWTYPQINDYYHNWWYPTYNIQYEKSKVDIAFKVVKKLMDKKLLAKKLTVKQFIDLVHEIAQEF